MSHARALSMTHAPEAATTLDRDATWFRVFLFGTAAVGPFSLNSFKPCLPWIQADFGAPMDKVQLSLSLSVLASAIATFSAGPLTDRYGRRPVLLASLALHMTGCLLGATALNIGMLVIGRALLAASSSVALVTARALIHDAFGAEESTRVIARVTMQTVLLVILAPMLGGLLIDLLGWRAVFLVTALFGAALFALAWVRLPESASRAPTYSEEKRLPKQRLQTLLRSRAFLGYAMQSSLHFAAFFAFASAASYLMVNVLNRAATEYGLWLVVPAVTVGAGLKAADSLATRVRSGVLALTGSVFVLAGMALFMVLLATGPLSTAVLFLPAALSAFGIGLALPATNAGVMSVAPDQAGTASGLLSAMNLLCAAVFAQLVAQDESRTATLLATLGVAGGALSVAFGLLSVGNRGPEARSEVHA